MAPAEVADVTFEASRARQLRMITHQEFDSGLRQHAEAMLAGRNPPTLGTG